MTAQVAVAAPPEVPRSASPGLLVSVAPLAISVVMLGITAAAFLSGSSATRSPVFLAFPAMTVASLAVTAVTGLGRGRDSGLDGERLDYLRYLTGLRAMVTEIAVAQHGSLNWTHPEPDMLFTLVGGPRMWERRPADADFCRVRVGRGTRPLATRLVAPQLPAGQRADPVTVTALRRFLRAHSTITDAPVALSLLEAVSIEGDAARVRGLIRAMVCQLAVLHPPDQVMIAAVASDRNRGHWDWLKWLPHNQHQRCVDAVGSARMVYATWAAAHASLSGAALPTVVIVDTDEPVGAHLAGAIILAVGGCGDGSSVVIRHGGEAETPARADWMGPVDALVCARLLAAYRASDRADGKAVGSEWANLNGIGEVDAFDPAAWWRNQNVGDRLRAPIGTGTDGTPVELDIKEPAENGMGPHGLCVGATGSGKSELLRTVALGMMARNCPEVLNLLLIDFKGGATFLDLGQSPHVAAVITNLADEAPLVARMKEALAGEMNRRQQLLRTAGNFVSVAAYENARRGGARLAGLPTLFIIVDEFSELLSQHPDFAEVFVAIGRLGRSLGMHLLLGSQRLDEGRLRGLEAHLSYRVCLKTLSPGDSRAVLGTLDAYELPNTPGAGWLRTATGELTRFQAAFVSGPLPPPAAAARSALPPEVRLFTSEHAGAVTGAAEVCAEPARSVFHAVLDRLAGHGPPAHRVWLPPLQEAPALDALLADDARRELMVPIAVVDRPFHQSRSPLTVDLSGAAGHVAVVGATRSGKSTALCTLITALAATHDAGRVQFYCLDFGGGVLASIRGLPHVGAVAGRSEPELVWRTVAELESVLRSRESSACEQGGSCGRPADVFLVVDGWATVRHEFGELEEPITALAAQGLSFGIHVMVSASRWAEIRPSLKDHIGTRIELRLGEPAESEVDRRQAQQVPRDRPGRGLAPDGSQMMVALPGPNGVDLCRHRGDAVAPPIPLLPARVDYGSVLRLAADQHILLGLEERELQPAAIDFDHQSHLVIFGDNECGKSATLRLLCREIVRARTPAQARLFIVDYRRTLLGVVESEHLGGYAMSAPALDAMLPGVVSLLRQRMPPTEVSQAQLRTRSWWAGPDIYLVVDDYDLVATTAGNPLLAALEYLPYATDLGLHLVIARRSGGAARAMFEPLLAGLRDFGCTALMMSGRPEEGALFGTSRPGPLPAGRGVLITRTGDERRVQVAWSPPP
ncbi:type VII secretion protein EccC [Mycobacterium kansasii]|uniref:ESX secretion system protein EccC n=1 Tax=Mycobacterium innocens TaxID=2341083 RepID=A0A498PQD1_9MYCO|nr:MULTISPECIES: type VII secretion protein EccCa [Mycobacterium]KZS68322.1 type VII secretion protein EccC [Mycobacterium kansasii]VBA35765.1 ESX secretion system protein EccC [Mycobacterium innocens]